VQNAHDCRRALSLGLWVLLVSSVGCVGVGQDLHAVSELYNDARYEEAEAWFAALRVDYVDMNAAQRTKYHYLRGMTEYRLAQPQEALHALALAAQAVRAQPEALSAEQRSVLHRTLDELAAATGAH
jgi:hypothetical protein